MFKVGQLHLSLFSYLLMNYSFICKYFLKNNTMRISLEKKKNLEKVINMKNKSL